MTRKCVANILVPKKNKFKYNLLANGMSELMIDRKASFHSVTGPADHLCCCLRYAAYTLGISFRHVISSRKMKRQPRKCALKLRSKSSTVLRWLQPPASSIQLLRQTQAVPLLLKNNPAQNRAYCSQLM